MPPFTPRITDPRTRDGELLWSTRFDERAVRALEELLADFGTAGQLQQRPSPRGGGIVKREHFRHYRTGEEPAFDLEVLSVDAAFKDTKDASYVVIQAWGRAPPRSYLLGQIRERLSFTKTLTSIRLMKQRYPRVGVVLIEDKANGPAIIDVLRREIPGVLPELPTGSKIARAEAAAPLIQAGNVYVPDPEEQPWVETFISEWCAVPTNAFWDQVDAASQVLLRYGRAMKANLGDSEIIGGAGATGGATDQSDSPWSSGMAGSPRS